ncbi:hypothetical protein R3P38DRAFT_2815842 [Favolaschia claudopus]|uniref:Uncharacterized protein n=1 Tax=Favolaschia claudopus TaxID=2862362 RepID=A0AAV9Z095_9AGAR
MLLLQLLMTPLPLRRVGPSHSPEVIPETPFTWDCWPDGDLRFSLTAEQFHATQDLGTNWVMETTRTKGKQPCQELAERTGNAATLFGSGGSQKLSAIANWKKNAWNAARRVACIADFNPRFQVRTADTSPIAPVVNDSESDHSNDANNNANEANTAHFVVARGSYIEPTRIFAREFLLFLSMR